MKHVLIVDDDADICEALQLILEASYRVTVARHGREALEVLLREPVDAVVLDLMMPVMDGETLVRELRARQIDVPLVFASAATSLAARAKSSGAAAWLQKPFEADQLERTLERVLSGGGGGSASGGGTNHDQSAAGYGGAGRGLDVAPRWA